MQRRYITVDVFTNQAFGGNPLAVVLDAGGLSTAQMQAVATEFNYSETTFVLPPQNPAHDAQVRICTGNRELPFAGHPKATNAWRVYEMASGRRAEEDHRFGGSLSEPPPVPTTAIFSRTDGICAWQGCMEKSSATAESIEVESSHCGMGHHPAVVYAVAERLAQPEGQWMPFDRSGWRSLIFPDPNR